LELRALTLCRHHFILEGCNVLHKGSVHSIQLSIILNIGSQDLVPTHGVTNSHTVPSSVKFN
jgi:hypothetical protein